MFDSTLSISAFFVLMVKLLAQNYNKVISNNWSISQETLYATIHSIVINQINSKNGQIYFPFVYTLFIFILVNNLVGLVIRSLRIYNFFFFFNTCKYYNKYQNSACGYYSGGNA